MKKSIILFLLCIAIYLSNSAVAQLALQWKAQYPANNIQLNRSCADPAGNIYIDAIDHWTNEHRILKYDTSGNLIFNKPALTGNVTVYSHTADENSIYWFYDDYTIDSIGLIRFDTAGNIRFHNKYSMFGNMQAYGTLPDNEGHVYALFVDTLYQPIIQKIDTAGNLIYQKPLAHQSQYSCGGSWDPMFFLRSGNIVFYLNTNYRAEITIIDTSGNFVDSAQINDVMGYANLMVEDNLGNLYLEYNIGDFGNSRTEIRKFDSNLIHLWTTVIPGLTQDLEVDSYANCYVLEYRDSLSNYNSIIHKIDSSGNVLWSHSLNPDMLVSYWALYMILDGNGCPVLNGYKFDSPVTDIGTITNKFFVEKLKPDGMPDDYYEGSYPNAYNHFTHPPLHSGSSNNITIVAGFNFNPDNIGQVLRFCTTCNNNVGGKIYYDANQNCQHDISEATLPMKIIEVTPGPYYSVSDQIGDYHFYLPDSIYSVWYHVPNNWMNTCPTAPVIDTISNLVGTSDSINFGVRQLTGFPDLLVNIAHTPVRPVRPITYYINYQNLGENVASGTIRFAHESFYQLQYSYPLPDSINGDTLVWNFTNLLSGESRNILLSFTIPLNTTGSYHNEALIEGMAGDVYLGNNLDIDSGTIVTAHDPNTKQVIPAGSGPEGFITVNDSILLYKIMFQNTGTDTAFHVLLVDTLDSDLEITSFRMGAVTHPYSLSVTGAGALKFYFQNIMLPDSVTDEEHSYVLLNYYINLKQNLMTGTEIRNFADVYFDFYPVVRTNSTINTIADYTGLPQYEEGSIVISPNPTSGFIQINLKGKSNLTSKDRYLVQVYDITGKQLFYKPDYYLNQVINLNSLNAGVYLIVVSNEKSIYRKKIIKTDIE